MRRFNEIQRRPLPTSAVPTVSKVLADGSLVEMVYDAVAGRTAFCIAHERRWRMESSLTVDGQRLVPYSPQNNLLQNNVVLLAAQPEEYGDKSQLLAAIQAFIHRYVDVSLLFEKIASYYVLLSWVYESYHELPYLRLRGDPGSGKTRFLLTVGSLCYKPIFASGASTVSPLFRILDAFRGTLIIDEGDFRFSDERAEIVKILNNGNAKGFPVLRSEVSPTREFNPRAYAVFGPKLVATRGYFEDRALESRCLTEELGQASLRCDVPINLPPACRQEALHIRNQLLLFRFRNFQNQPLLDHLVDRAIEPRLNQIFVPLLSLIDDPVALADLRQLAARYHRDLINERGLDAEAELLEVIQDILREGDPLTVKEMTGRFTVRFGEGYEQRITPRWVGSILRKRLRLKTQKSHGVYVLPPTEAAKLPTLFRRFGLSGPSADEAPASRGTSA